MNFSMSQDFNSANYFSDHIRIKVGVDLPDFQCRTDYDLWAKSLLEREGWSSQQEPTGLDPLSGDDRLFLHSTLQTLRLLCELGRLPIFDPPRVVSLSKDPETPKKLALEIELLLAGC